MAENKTRPTGASVADFIAEELVPGMASQYPLAEGAENRALMGASFGGVASLHAAQVAVLAWRDAWHQNFPTVTAALQGQPPFRSFVGEGRYSWRLKAQMAAPSEMALMMLTTTRS